MIRGFDTAAIVTHARYRRLPEPAQALYMALLQAANTSGHIDPIAAVSIMSRMGQDLRALEALAHADLLDNEPHREGFWIVLPSTLDGAEIFAEARR